MARLPFPEYRPDVSDNQAAASQNIRNVVPRADGYGPFKALLAFTSVLPARCRGYFFARNGDGTVTLFAGTATKLYKLSNTDFTWSDISAGGGSYTSVPTGGQWQFAQFNTRVIAVQANVVPQSYVIGSSSAFAALAGSPPQAAFVTIVNRFVFLSGLTSDPSRCQWCGFNNPTQWTPGTEQSDFQDLPDGGIVRGVAGFDLTGVIFQDASLRALVYAPGSPYIFQITRISNGDGIYAPYSMVIAQDRIFFISPQGFKVLGQAGYPMPIGREKVDRTFFADVDTSQLQLVLAATDPQANRVYWAYKSTHGLTGLFDTILAYDWVLERWSRLAVAGEYIATLSKPGVTLDGLDAISASIDALPFSLDDVSSASLASLSAVSSTHAIGFFNGANLEAAMETAEQGTAARRMLVRGFRVITDAPTIYGSVSRRENPQASYSYSTETAVNALGICPARVSTRYARGRVRIPAGTAWTYAAAIEPDIALEGTR